MSSLNGKAVIVTGAARGIGQAYAKAIVAAGGRVLAADKASCAETLALLAGHPGCAAAVEVDVTDAASTRAMAAAALEQFGRIDGLVNNAAFYANIHGGRFDQIDEKEWDLTMAVNVKGIWNCCKAVVESMRNAGHGSIVNISSVAALYGTPYSLQYTTSKAAVLGLTRGLARELGRYNIRVNSVAPSAVTTEATRSFFGPKYDAALKTASQQQCIARNMAPEDIAGAVVWLLSDASAFVSGQTVPVDGGTVLL